MTEGWLVLSQSVLSFYDRDPRNMPRKPTDRFVLNQPGVAYVILPSINRAKFPRISKRLLMNAFGLQVYNSSTSRDFCLVAPSLQSKIDWVQRIQKVLIQYGSPLPPQTGCGDEAWMLSNKVEEEPTRRSYGMRELKEVTIVPINSPSKKLATASISRTTKAVV